MIEGVSCSKIRCDDDYSVMAEIEGKMGTTLQQGVDQAQRRKGVKAAVLLFSEKPLKRFSRSFVPSLTALKRGVNEKDL